MTGEEGRRASGGRNGAGEGGARGEGVGGEGGDVGVRAVGLVVRVASQNPGKVRELAAALAGCLDLRPPPERWTPPPETGATFEENALLKARSLVAATAEAALADDSGLEVEALGGRPGVRSARYAATDRARIERLLAELRGLPAAARVAHFRCVLALVRPDGSAEVAAGTCAGRILEVPRGNGGFGYDPVFFVPEAGRTFAEMAPAEKERFGHRGRAARALADRLRSP